MPISDLETRLEEELGVQLYRDYIEGIAERKATDFCDSCIRNQKRKAKGKWFIECHRSTDELTKEFAKRFPGEPTKAELAAMVVDGVLWAEYELGWKARWYQSQAMRCTSQWQCHRWGRRTGKTNFLAIKSLHLCATKPGAGMDEPYTVLLVTPYEDQLDKIFQYARDALIKSENFKPIRDIRDPHLLGFANNSKMIGFTAGDKTGARSDKIRGQDANAIVIDEADRIRSDDIDAVMAILASHADCRLYFSTTPTGLQTRFKSSCEDPERGFREFWFSSYESPEYTDRADYQFKRSYPRTTYEHEILATFGSAEGGVFMPSHLNKAIEDYPLGQQPLPHERVIIGVDCNDPNNGTHAVVMAVDNQKEIVRLLDKEILRGEEFSKVASEEMLIMMYRKWQPMYLAFDKGYTHGQIDDLRAYGLQNPQMGLTEALKLYDMGSTYKWNDPITAQQIARPMKPLMVGISQRFLQEGRMILPKCEDVESGVIGQMRNFYVKRTGQDGRPIYSDEGEHTLTGMMVALLCWQLEVLGFEPTVKDTTLFRTLPARLPKNLPLPINLRTQSDPEAMAGPGSSRIPSKRVQRAQLGKTSPVTRVSRVKRNHF
jgi:hypothetical protein